MASTYRIAPKEHHGESSRNGALWYGLLSKGHSLTSCQLSFGFQLRKRSVAYRPGGDASDAPCSTHSSSARNGWLSASVQDSRPGLASLPLPALRCTRSSPDARSQPLS